MLGLLAASYGVQASYVDGTGRRRAASPEAVLAVLRALGAPLDGASELRSARREREAELGRRALDPVVVAWEGETTPSLTLRLPRRGLASHLRLRLELEAGGIETRETRVARLGRRERRLDGEPLVALELALPRSLPAGYHELSVECGRHRARCRVIAAPRRACEAPPGERAWGVFAPLYALGRQDGPGVGDYSDLERLVDWTAGCGGRAVATLPLFAGFLDGPLEPSPYRPVSRRLWSELHVSRAGLGGGDRRRRALGRWVDYRAEMRATLALLGRRGPPAGRDARAFREFLKAHPLVTDYARFRATLARRGKPWPLWPERLRAGRLRPGDFDPEVEATYAYAQWVATRELEAVAAHARARDVKLVLDLPLGVHPQGFDTWRERGLFALRASAGAPPDALFTGGQCWVIPPVLPERSRETGHRYFAECLAQSMAVAGLLRLDHVMALHRLYWVPEGHGAEDGVYVRYPAEELYAVVTLESRRHGCPVQGEDLGTVPGEVRQAMRRRGLLRSFVLPLERPRDRRRPVSSRRGAGVAVLRTHDMPAFATFWRGLDPRERARWVRDLRDTGRLRSTASRPAEVLQALLALLGESRAPLVLVDLEDLWGERRAHNVPGTTREHPNWRRRLRHPLESFSRLSAVRRLLSELDRARRGR